MYFTLACQRQLTMTSMSALRLLQTMSEAGRMWLSSFTGQEEDNIQILPLKLSPTLGQWCGQIITSVYIHVISKQVDIRVSLMRSVIIISQILENKYQILPRCHCYGQKQN